MQAPSSDRGVGAPLTVLYVCLFLLIKKLEQFRTTIHCRCADMAATAAKGDAGNVRGAAGRNLTTEKGCSGSSRGMGGRAPRGPRAPRSLPGGAERPKAAGLNSGGRDSLQGTRR